MALTITPLLKWTQQQGEFLAIILVTGDATYPNTGGTIGYPITPATFTFQSGFASTSDFQAQTPLPPPFYVWDNVAPAGAAGGFVKVDGTTGNLRFFGPTGTEIANGASAAGISAVLAAFGH